jgi:hypothetical protein
MRTLFLVFLLLLGCSFSRAQVQNLAPNPSFEEYDGVCDWDSNGIYTRHWSYVWCNPLNHPNWYRVCLNATNNQGLPDYYSIPRNDFWGYYQLPRTGEAYQYVYVNFRNPHGSLSWLSDIYLKTKLLDSLKSGKRYCIGSYLNLANTVDEAPNYYRFFSDHPVVAAANFGFYLSRDSLIMPAGCMNNNSDNRFDSLVPQIRNDPSRLWIDTLNWNPFFQIYKAQGGEQYMTFGNFDSLAADVLDTVFSTPYCDSLAAIPNHPGCGFVTTLFLDDVGVFELPDLNAGIDDTICAGEQKYLQGSVSGAWWQGLNTVWRSSGGPVNDSLSAGIYVKPNTSTAYYFCLKDTGSLVPCVSEVIDTVWVFVREPDAFVSAGADTTLCPGDTLVLPGSCNGCSSSASYAWSPATDFDDASLLQPSLIVSKEQSYLLSVEDSLRCLNKRFDAIRIRLAEESSCTEDSITSPTPPLEIIIPNLLLAGEAWQIQNLDPEAIIMLFNSAGQLLFFQKASTLGSHPLRLSGGMYFYRIILPNQEIWKGKVCVVKG